MDLYTISDVHGTEIVCSVDIGLFFFIFAVLLVRHKYGLSGTMSINEINIFI